MQEQDNKQKQPKKPLVNGEVLCHVSTMKLHFTELEGSGFIYQLQASGSAEVDGKPVSVYGTSNEGTNELVEPIAKAVIKVLKGYAFTEANFKKLFDATSLIDMDLEEHERKLEKLFVILCQTFSEGEKGYISVVDDQLTWTVTESTEDNFHYEEEEVDEDNEDEELFDDDDESEEDQA